MAMFVVLVSLRSNPSLSCFVPKLLVCVQMGRPSLLEGGADHSARGEVTEVRIGGHCVAMMAGTIVSSPSQLFVAKL